jgi:hypothetical protein
MAGTVTVACKVPNGLWMQVFQMEDAQEPVMGGGWKTVKRAVRAGQPVKINGPAVAYGKPAPHDIRFGVGLTYGVDADFYTAWAEQNKGSDFIVKRLVYAHAKTIEIDAQSKDQVSIKSGMEPIDPHNLPDEFKRKITTAART